MLFFLSINLCRFSVPVHYHWPKQYLGDVGSCSTLSCQTTGTTRPWP